MPPPPFDVLAAAARHVPAALVPAEALAAGLRVAAGLPPAFNWIGFECRLQAGDDRVDYAGCCEAWDGGRAALASTLADAPSFAGPGVRALLAEWCREGSQLYKHSPAVWLEFDFVANAPPASFAFLCLDPACANAFHAPVRPHERPPPGQLMELFMTGARLLAGQEPATPAVEFFARSLAALPPTGRALHVAATPHRGHADLRVHYALLTGEVAGWLADIGWAGDMEWARGLPRLLGGFRQVGVQLSVGTELRQELGVEAYVAGGPTEFAGWSRLFGALGDACDPAKVAALLGWWGREKVTLGPWRVAIQRQFYVKLTMRPTGLEAKAYLCIMPRHVLL